MHPAYSVILFTTASGAGYGLLFLLCLFGATGALPAARWLGFTGFALAFVLITVGLLASTFHLGHPERAWRAMSQWRSSWLSREGVAALATYLPSGLFAIGWVFFEATGGLWALFGALGAVLAVVTVFCTGMIYQSLATIRQWHNVWVTPGYLVLALASGAVWFALIALLFGQGRPLFLWLALLALALGLLIKLGYWRGIDAEARTRTIENATGLGRFGKVSQLEAPHTQTNYLMREMGHQVARKHARKLRAIALAFGFALPLLAVLIALAAGGPWAILAMLLAAVFVTFGLLVERWLFFAEAQHVVTLYYGAKVA